MKTLELNQMEQIEGGGWFSTAVGLSCGALVIGAAVSTGPLGVAALAALGPSVCIGGGLTAALAD